MAGLVMKGECMKTYLVEFSVAEGKIPMIKLVRHLTNASLRDAKDFVEAKFNNFDFQQYVKFIVTQDQLGKFLIVNTITPPNSHSLMNVRELEEYNATNLTQMYERQ
jgi:hypothetical protein